MSGVDDIYRAYLASLDREQLEERTIAALNLLVEYGQEDGAHHKMWVIDQAVRTLTGRTYPEVIHRYQHPDGPNDQPGDYYEWDEGIAP